MMRADFVLRWGPVLLWMLVIFAASSDLGSAEHTSRFLIPFLLWLTPDISPATLAAVQLSIRKAAHLTEYAILGALLLRAVTVPSGRPRWQYAAVAIALAGAFAAMDEFHQTFVQSRTGSPHDVLIDISGAALGLTIWWLFIRRRQKARVPAVA